ncbi:response regulator transcription factor [Archangium violaceum]|uniref:LytR/AlgR family response regulator transcription factor n=1 Tax=Archangium violaceum TaxID=83451 RepID=UPI00194FCFBE|nr:LytTR family DNA-binding domain-containing protein [Archangium violaceum]QRN95245.1 response regulator transcription factor [Archangium violaceum]
MIRAVLADDEPLARARLRALLAQAPDVQLVAECADGVEALEVLRRERPDIVFLDVQMPERDGFGVLEALEPPMPLVIFVTAYQEHAVRAFEASAVDYLLKPFDRERFARTLARVRERLRQSPPSTLPPELSMLLQRLSHPASPETPAAPWLERLVVKTARETLLVRVEDVDWLEAAGNYVTVHVGREEYLVRETLEGLEAQLPTRSFARVHRSTIVNLDRIRSIRPTPGGDHRLVLRDGHELTLSRTFRARLEERLGRPL